MLRTGMPFSMDGMIRHNTTGIQNNTVEQRWPVEFISAQYELNYNSVALRFSASSHVKALPAVATEP